MIKDYDKNVQSLFPSRYISYPRTETSAYPPTFDLHAVLVEQVGKCLQRILDH